LHSNSVPPPRRLIRHRSKCITDRHRFSTQLNWINEKQDLDATFGSGGSSNSSNRMWTFKGKLTYYYDTKCGATLGYLRTHRMQTTASITPSHSTFSQTALSLFKKDRFRHLSYYG
jgi:hypothetical protein